MNTREKLEILKYVIGVRLGAIKFPIAVRWNITNKCTASCIYCSFPEMTVKGNTKELSIQEMLPILKEMHSCGIRRISLSGGEPLLRQDLGEIIKACSGLGIKPELNASGKFMPERIKEIERVSLIKLSLDGEAGVHELSRHSSTFKEVMLAAEACARHKIKFAFCTTLTKHNTSPRHLKNLLEIARQFDAIVAFQPLKAIPQSPQDVQKFYPLKEDFNSTVLFLIEERKKGNKYIRNSLPGLHYILQWPHYNNIKCWAGRAFCIIDPDGTLLPCDRVFYDAPLPNCAKEGFRNGFNRLPKIKGCSGCGFCGTIELNFLMSLNLRGIDPIKKYA